VKTDLLNPFSNDYKKQIEFAKDILERKSNPQYQPDAFLIRQHWSL
jgi:hypothetical protein